MEPTRPGHKTGKWMLIFTWIIILVGLTALFGDWEEKQYNPNQTIVETSPGEITLIRNRMNHYVLNGKINGIDVVFLLDTGATQVAVPAALGEKLGLLPGQAHQAMTANGIVTVRSTVIDQLEIGPIRLNDIRASLNPGMQGPQILLGMSALKDLEFTQSGNQLTLKTVN